MVVHMGHIQIRNVPPALHRTLKARAALAGRSLSEYLLDDLREQAAAPTTEEILERIAALSAEAPAESSADAVRSERDRP